jgi:hypothetical protein
MATTNCDSAKDFLNGYSGANRTWAEWIGWHLRAAGYTGTLQGWDFRPGANFMGYGCAVPFLVKALGEPEDLAGQVGRIPGNH